MKGLSCEYYKMALYTMIGLIFIVSIYMIIINIHHYSALSYKVVVSEADIDYVNYKKNINDIEDNLKKDTDKKLTASLNSTLTILKNGGVFRLLPKSNLTYHDLYELNNYFINDIINTCWVRKLKELNSDELNNQMMEVLINNSMYLNKHFIDNGLNLYDSYNEERIQDDYHAILKNYLSFSNMILLMSKGG